MDSRIKEFLMMPYMQHIRKLLKHLILLERSIDSSKIRRVNHSFQMKRGRTSPLITTWAKNTHPLEITPPLSHRLKIIHFDVGVHNLLKWNDVHTMDVSDKEPPNLIKDFSLDNALSQFEISTTLLKRTIKYGIYPISCSMDILEGQNETSISSLIIINADTLADFSMKFTNPKYLKDPNPEKRMMATLAQMEFSPRQYRNCIYYIFEYLDYLSSMQMDVSLMPDDTRESYKILLEILDLPLI